MYDFGCWRVLIACTKSENGVMWLVELTQTKKTELRGEKSLAARRASAAEHAITVAKPTSAWPWFADSGSRNYRNFSTQSAENAKNFIEKMAAVKVASMNIVELVYQKFKTNKRRQRKKVSQLQKCSAELAMSQQQH
jgi:hypothetical protein